MMDRGRKEAGVAGEKPVPKKLKLVRMEGPLGDLSGMTATERAELVQQEEQRKIMEAITRAEAEPMAEIVKGAKMLAIFIPLALTLHAVVYLFESRPRTWAQAWSDLGETVVGVIGGAVMIASCLVAIYGTRWFLAVQRRRRLMEGRSVLRAMRRVEERRRRGSGQEP